MNHSLSKSSLNISGNKLKKQTSKNDKKVPISRLSVASIHRKESVFNSSVDSSRNALNRKSSVIVKQQSFASRSRTKSFQDGDEEDKSALNRNANVIGRQQSFVSIKTKSFLAVDEEDSLSKGSEDTDTSSLSSSSSIAEDTEEKQAADPENDEDESMEDSTEYFRSLRKK